MTSLSSDRSGADRATTPSTSNVLTPDDGPSDRRDVVIVGGGPAGLSAALALGRSRRSVVILDAGRPRNSVSPHMHGVLGFDGRPPADYLDAGRADIAEYGVEIITANAIDATRIDADTLAVTLDDGSTITARRILVASGLTDELPAVTGLAARWGNDVLHCPYCHGWEVRDQKLAVLSSGPMSVHQALLFRQWSPDITVFTHTGPALTFQDELTFSARGIATVDGAVAEVMIEEDRIVALRMASGEVHPADAIVVGPRMVAHSAVLESFGLAPVAGPLGPDVGMAYEAAPTGRTSVPGVWAIGNCVDPTGTVPAVVAAGYTSGAVINADLIEEENAAAIAAIGTDSGHRVFDEAFWDRRYNSAGQIWSGNPNPHLVADLSGVEPGRALDVGAGEGADAIWLAKRGWEVTALDISSVALDRGRAQAQHVGAEVAGRITWTRTDVLESPFPTGPFDLVTAQFMHFVEEQRTALFRRCIDAVAPGGTLQIVGHHPSDMETSARHPHMPGFYYTAEEVAALLDDDWTIVAADARPRPVTDADGQHSTIHDTVLLATRTTS
ncbi:MAG: bifunctional NAD(P)/FAD-dependent oxidoreductase/class I SAM-dependent methyltransferase [Ilumatobacteraceae bacterium]